MFILMGEIASHSGLGNSLFDTFQTFIWHRRGGLAFAVQIVCAIFGAICGSLIAGLALMGNVAYPAMKKNNYDDRLSASCIVAGAPLVTLIPPSLTLIVFGIISETSIGKLFVGGITVGILVLIAYSITIMIWTRINPNLAPTRPKASWQERQQSLKKGGLIEVAIVFAIAMGGLFGGLFTPTEAGAIGMVGMTAVAIIFRRFSFEVLKKAVISTVGMSAMIYFLVAAASTYGSFFTLSTIPAALGCNRTWLGRPCIFSDQERRRRTGLEPSGCQACRRKNEKLNY